MAKKTVWLTLIGYLAGCGIGLCFMFRDGAVRIGDVFPRILADGIPGAAAMGASVIYDIEKWSIFRTTATHFLITMGAICFGTFVLGWFAPWSAPFWIMMGAGLAAYILIWLIMYMRCRARVRELNRLLEENRE